MQKLRIKILFSPQTIEDAHSSFVFKIRIFVQLDELDKNTNAYIRDIYNVTLAKTTL